MSELLKISLVLVLTPIIVAILVLVALVIIVAIHHIGIWICPVVLLGLIGMIFYRFLTESYPNKQEE